jgi:hypothetical protein
MEQETAGRWQSFLISRVHDKLLLMSDEEKEAIFVKSVCEQKKALFCLKYIKTVLSIE